MGTDKESQRTAAENQAYEVKAKIAALQRHIISYGEEHEKLIERIFELVENNEVSEEVAKGLRSIIHDMRSMVNWSYNTIDNLIGAARKAEVLCAHLIVKLEVEREAKETTPAGRATLGEVE